MRFLALFLSGITHECLVEWTLKLCTTKVKTIQKSVIFD